MKFYQKLIGLTTTGAEKIIEFSDTEGFIFNDKIVPNTNESASIGTSTKKFANGYFKSLYASTQISAPGLVSSGNLSLSAQGAVVFDRAQGSFGLYIDDAAIYTSGNGSLELGKVTAPFTKGYFEDGYFTNGYFSKIGSSSSKVTKAFFTTIDTANMEINGNRIRKSVTKTETESGTLGILVSWDQAPDTAPSPCVFVGI